MKRWRCTFPFGENELTTDGRIITALQISRPPVLYVMDDSRPEWLQHATIGKTEVVTFLEAECICEGTLVSPTAFEWTDRVRELVGRLDQLFPEPDISDSRVWLPRHVTHDAYVEAGNDVIVVAGELVGICAGTNPAWEQLPRFTVFK